MNEQTVYVILTEWICEWQESVEITHVAFPDRKTAQSEMQHMALEAIRAFPSSPYIEQCDGYCELSTQGPYGTDCVKFSVVPIQIPGATMEVCP